MTTRIKQTQSGYWQIVGSDGRGVFTTNLFTSANAATKAYRVLSGDADVTVADLKAGVRGKAPKMPGPPPSLKGAARFTIEGPQGSETFARSEGAAKRTARDWTKAGVPFACVTRRTKNGGKQTLVCFKAKPKMAKAWYARNRGRDF